MGKEQDRSSTPPADGPPPLGRHDGVEPNIPWSTQATPTIAGTPSPSRRGADPGTAAHLVGAAGYPADPRPPSGSLLNAGAGEHRPAPWQRVHDLPRDSGRGQTRQRRVNLNQKCVWPVCPVPPHKLLLMPTTPPTAFPKEGVKKLLPVASYDVETIACQRSRQEGRSQYLHVPATQLWTQY